MKYKQILSLCICMILVLNVLGQDSLSQKLIGKWGICSSVDVPDTACAKPFNTYIFNADGTCQHGSIISMGEEIPVTGKWRMEKGSVSIVYDKLPYFSSSNETFTDIVFINERLFYYKVYDTYEVKGHWVYFSFRKLD